VTFRHPESATVRAANAADAAGVAAIYNHYVGQTVVTFEEEAVPAAEIARRMQDAAAASLPWLTAEASGSIVGYAYAANWRVRHAYRFSVEVTAYIAPDHARRGIGSSLYTVLIAALRARGIHAAIGGIALPNDASIALHEKFGFRKVAHFEQVGFKFKHWIDVGYWQLIL
jgi:L-amino acid N-acyltransferase YncA